MHRIIIALPMIIITPSPDSVSYCSFTIAMDQKAGAGHLTGTVSSDSHRQCGAAIIILI